MALNEFTLFLSAFIASAVHLLAQILSMRFSDGQGAVSIPEFLEFFTTPAQIRMARAATSAVRMSLDLLQLKDDEQAEPEDEDGMASPETKDVKLRSIMLPSNCPD